MLSLKIAADDSGAGHWLLPFTETATLATKDVVQWSLSNLLTALDEFVLWIFISSGLFN